MANPGVVDMLGASSNSDFLALVSLLSDPDKLKQAYQDLQKAKSDAQAVIDLVGPAKEILSLQMAAKNDRTAAAVILSDAQQQHQDLVDAATQDAHNLINTAQAAADDINMKANQTLADAKDKLDAAQALNIKYQEMLDMTGPAFAAKDKELNDALNAAEQREQAASEVQAKYEAALERVTNAIEVMQGQLNEQRSNA